MDAERKSVALAAYSRALAMDMAGDHPSAVAYYERVLAADPGHEESYFRAAAAYLRLDQEDEAVRITESLLKNHPASSRAWKWAGLVYQAAGYPEKALSCFQQAGSIEPHDPEPWHLGAVLLAGMNQTDEALAMLQRGVETARQPAKLHRMRAMLLLNLAEEEAMDPQRARRKAAQALEEAVAAKPGHLDTLFDLAAVYFMLDETEQALACYRRILDTSPDNPEILLKLGAGLAGTGRTEEAVDILERLSRQLPDEARLYLLLGELYQKLDRGEEAVAAFRRASEQAPRTPEPYLWRALLQVQEAPEKALDALREGRDALPDDVRLVKLLASIALESEAYEEALNASRDVERMLEEEDRTPSAAARLVHALAAYYTGDLEAAADQLSAATGEAPAMIEAFLQHLFIRQANEDKRQAALDVLRDLASQPGRRTVGAIGKGLLYNMTERYSEALESFERAQGTAAGEEVELGAGFFFSFGAACERSGQIERAVELFKQCLEIDPDHALALNYLAYMWAERGLHLERALVMSQRSLELQPDDPAFLDTLGWIYYQQGIYEKALTYIQRAVELLPQDATILDHLGDVYLALDRPQDAEKHWRKALEHDPENEEAIKEKIDSLTGRNQ